MNQTKRFIVLLIFVVVVSSVQYVLAPDTDGGGDDGGSACGSTGLFNALTISPTNIAVAAGGAPVTVAVHVRAHGGANGGTVNFDVFDVAGDKTGLTFSPPFFDAPGGRETYQDSTLTIQAAGNAISGTRVFTILANFYDACLGYVANSVSTSDATVKPDVVSPNLRVTVNPSTSTQTTITQPTTDATTTPTTPTISSIPSIYNTYYCRQDGRFATDLDTPAAQVSDTALNTKNKATCEKAGFKWTGTKCCSEDDDNLTRSTLREYYNDAGGSGSCWNSTLITSISLVQGTNDSVLNYNGEFHGCAIEKTNYNTKNDNLLGLIDKHTGANLIKNHNYCFNITQDTYYCSYTEKWMPTDGADKTHLSSAPFAVVQNPNQTAECCAPMQCWDGEKCIDSQKSKPTEQPLNGKRCIDGEWMPLELKFTPDGTSSGYCPSETQCLVDPLAADEKSQCVNSTEFIGDNYCENGNWSTRTKLTALKLLKLKSGDYNVFCDNRENVLNVLQYQLASGETAFNVLTSIQANNFCVLKTSGKTIVGVSINKNLTSTDNLEVFGVANCANGLIYDGQYHSCDSTNKVWYNGKLQSIIFSTTAISIPVESDPLASFNQLIGTPIQNVINSIKRLITTPPVDDSYTNGIRKYDRLYIAQQGPKTITSSIEKGNLIAEYKNFDNDICKYIEQFNSSKSDDFSGAACKRENNNFYVLAQGSEFTNLNPEAIWQDLTSKLRIK